MKAKILAGIFALAFLAACGTSGQPAEEVKAADTIVAVDTNAVDTSAVDSSAVVAPAVAPAQ